MNSFSKTKIFLAALLIFTSFVLAQAKEGTKSTLCLDVNQDNICQKDTEPVTKVSKKFNDKLALLLKKKKNINLLVSTVRGNNIVDDKTTVTTNNIKAQKPKKKKSVRKYNDGYDYAKNPIVCLDINNDGMCQRDTEPYSKINKNFKYKLKLSKDQQKLLRNKKVALIMIDKNYISKVKKPAVKKKPKKEAKVVDDGLDAKLLDEETEAKLLQDEIEASLADDENAVVTCDKKYNFRSVAVGEGKDITDAVDVEDAEFFLVDVECKEGEDNDIFSIYKIMYDSLENKLIQTKVYSSMAEMEDKNIYSYSVIEDSLVVKYNDKLSINKPISEFDNGVLISNRYEYKDADSIKKSTKSKEQFWFRDIDDAKDYIKSL